MMENPCQFITLFLLNNVLLWPVKSDNISFTGKTFFLGGTQHFNWGHLFILRKRFSIASVLTAYTFMLYLKHKRGKRMSCNSSNVIFARLFSALGVCGGLSPAL